MDFKKTIMFVALSSLLVVGGTTSFVMNQNDVFMTNMNIIRDPDDTIAVENDTIDISFPEIQDFATINADYQSVDPDLYNFQMWCNRDGLYAYFVQYTNPVTTNTNQWLNTHVEMHIWNGDFGYGWDGTYVALFMDDTHYFNNTLNVKSHYSKCIVTELDGLKKIEYYFFANFDNNTPIGEPPYAYVKQYQCMPEVDEATATLNSQFITRDDRRLITGDEKSFQVHNTIDAKMYT